MSRELEPRGATDTPGSQSALREANLRRVLRAVRAAGSPTQAEIARFTGLSAATVPRAWTPRRLPRPLLRPILPRQQ